MSRTYSCELCHRYAKSDTPDGQSHLICDNCSDDHKAVVALYNRIIKQFPQYNRLSPAEVFERIFNKVVSKE